MLKLIQSVGTLVSSGDDKNPAAFIGRMYAVSSLLAVIIAVPAVVVAVVLHFVLKEQTVVTLAASVITLFVGMGFGFKLAKRFARAPQKGGQ
jgi:hypothetical protein